MRIPFRWTWVITLSQSLDMCPCMTYYYSFNDNIPLLAVDLSYFPLLRFDSYPWNNRSAIRMFSIWVCTNSGCTASFEAEICNIMAPCVMSSLLEGLPLLQVLHEVDVYHISSIMYLCVIDSLAILLNWAV